MTEKLTVEVLSSILASKRDEFTEENNISSVRLMRGRCHRIIADKTLDTISKRFGREYVVNTYDGTYDATIMVTRKHYTGISSRMAGIFGWSLTDCILIRSVLTVFRVQRNCRE